MNEVCENKNTNIDYEKLADRMYELYVSKNYPFIIQHEDGNYEWKYNWGSLQNNKQILIKHLQSKQTVGVFCHTHTKFICFDVDFGLKNILTKWVTHKLVNILEEFGFDNKYINVSLSGSKGYHVLIFFDDIVSYKQIQYLYDLVLEQLYYSIDYDNLNVSEGNWNMTLDELKMKIELRPQSQLGVKLELSIHQVTKNKCYFCDNITLEPIKSIEYLYKINQCPREYIEEAITYGYEFRKDRNNINQFKNIIKNTVPAKSQNLYTDEDFTVEYIENLINNGLQIEGSRHNSLMKIARYYFHYGYSKEDNEKLLIEWMFNQNQKLYKSTELEWRKDIKRILEFVYENNRGLMGQVRDISINKNEMMEILKHREKSKKLLFYALIIHAKRYSIKNGEFYMTYEQIAESVHIGRDSIFKYLHELENEGEIIIIRQNEKRNNSYLNLPNKYIIKNSIIQCNNINKNDYIVYSYIKELDKEYDKNIINMFDKKELRTILPNYQYREISKLYTAI
jgi:hypothetical protein